MEIDIQIDLTESETRLLDAHSALNILNIVMYQLMVLSDAIPKGVPSEELNRANEDVHTLAELIRDNGSLESLLAGVQNLRKDATEGIQKAIPSLNEELQSVFAKSHANLEGIFSIFEIRINELIKRKDKPYSWEVFLVKRLEINLKRVFEAMAQNSGGAYDFVFNAPSNRSNCYSVDLKFEGGGKNKDSILIPSVLQDVIRDLIANARKYTAPGGSLGVDVSQNNTHVIIEVTDTGIGIPKDELPEVILFGHRAKNALGKRTFGGGFGLTKAYYLVKLFAGRMWIESSTDTPSGTKIRIEIPIPEEHEQ